MRVFIASLALASGVLSGTAAHGADASTDAQVMKRLTHERDTFISRAHDEGYSVCPAPAIALGAPTSFGGFDPDSNTVQVATWDRLAPEQRQRFEAELNARQNLVKQLQLELQTARAEHAAAQAEKDRRLADRDRRISDLEARFPDTRDVASTRRRRFFGR